MAEYLIQDTTLTEIAESIRSKTNKTDNIFVSNFADEINNIETGIDTSDATAATSDILSGKTAYVNGEKITGNIPTQAAKTITPKSSSQTAVAANVYTTGTVTVAGDADLVSGNIKKGIDIFGVDGTYTNLNFEVVGGTTAPANPTENMIWVNTSTAIERTVIISGTPTAVEGRVWIKTATSSAASFQAIKDNVDCSLYVYPVYARQYIDGAWVSKVAKTYKDGAWVDWIFYIYNAGTTSYGITRKAMKTTSDGYAAAATPSLTMNAGSFFSDLKGAGYAGITYITSKIDLTAAKTLYVEGDFFGDGNVAWPRFAIWSAIGTYANSNMVAYKALITEGAVEQTKTVSIDVSNLSGSYYIGFVLVSSANQGYVRVRKLYYK